VLEPGAIKTCGRPVAAASQEGTSIHREPSALEHILAKEESANRERERGQGRRDDGIHQIVSRRKLRAMLGMAYVGQQIFLVLAVNCNRGG
jgi:hypothetical protein